MKKILTLVLVLVSLGGFAQEEAQFKKLISCSGGMASAGSAKLATVSGRLGGFATDNIVLGLDGGFARFRMEDWNLQVVDIGPFIRRYYIRNNMGVFMGAQASYAFNKATEYYLYGSSSEAYTAFLFGPDFGLDIFLTKSAAIEILVHYQFEKSSMSDTNLGTAFVAEFGVTVFL